MVVVVVVEIAHADIAMIVVIALEDEYMSSTFTIIVYLSAAKKSIILQIKKKNYEKNCKLIFIALLFYHYLLY